MTHRTLFRTLAAALAASLLGTGCSPDRLAAPDAGPSLAAADHIAPTSSKPVIPTVPIDTVGVLQWEKPLKQNMSVTVKVSPKGGHVDLGATGLTLYFAPGAVSQTLTVTATAYAGSAVAYSFEPHGTVFNAPVYVVQRLDHTTYRHARGLNKTVQGAYMPDGLADLSADGKTAVVSEVYNTAIEKLRDRLGQLAQVDAVFEIHHFSGYILTGGRR